MLFAMVDEESFFRLYLRAFPTKSLAGALHVYLFLLPFRVFLSFFCAPRLRRSAAFLFFQDGRKKISAQKLSLRRGRPAIKICGQAKKHSAQKTFNPFFGRGSSVQNPLCKIHPKTLSSTSKFSHKIAAHRHFAYIASTNAITEKGGKRKTMK